jgi:D-alanyl-D-alanine carboxypeptidase
MKNADELLKKEVESGRTPSVQYAFFQESSIIHEFFHGYSDLSSGLKADGNTTFPIYSITKTLTALSIVQLMEKGMLELDKPARHYLPYVNVPEVTTIRHLLTHTAGLANPLPVSWIHLTEEHPGFDRHAFFEPILARQIRRNKTPGSQFKYSNLGYLILGQLIESVTGRTYEDYVRSQIVNALKLESEVLDFDIPQITLHATGYHRRFGLSLMLLNFLLDTSKYMDTPVSTWKPFKKFYVNGAPYGGLIANVHAMVRYGQALLKTEHSLLSEKSKKILFTENNTKNGKPTGMCLSWFKGKLEGQTYYTHAGGGGGYYCELRLYPEIKSGSFIVFNRSGFSDERFLDKVDTCFLKILASSKNKTVISI